MIVVIGLSPAVQRTLRFTGPLAVGQVNRAAEAYATASGKAVNVARLVAQLGSPTLLVHPLGGEPGHWMEQTLNDQGVDQSVVQLESDESTRTCTTILAGGVTTELVEEAPALSESDLRWLFDASADAIGQATAVCLSGSLPAGVPDDLYAQLLREARFLNVPVIVDAQGEPLKKALAERPFLVKPNLTETRATLGLPSSATALDAAQALCEAGATWALVTDGPAGAVLAGPDEEPWQVTPPKVSAINPIGAGDCLAAGLLVSHFRRGRELREAAAFGTACAAASCLTLTSGAVERSDIERLEPLVKVATARRPARRGGKSKTAGESNGR